jgi:iron(II)-dependent oxidoreductase
LARYPVTVAQFTTFVEEENFQVRDESSLRGLPNRPVVNVTWHEALAFCRRLTQQWQQQGFLSKEWHVTLPSEAEWEKAARGGLEIPDQGLIKSLNQIEVWQPKVVRQPNLLPQRRFPWGDDINLNRVNYDETGIDATSSMGCFPEGASPYGCQDLSGNVWEWTRSHFRDYPYSSDDGREELEAGSDVPRVLRGGAFDLDERLVRCAIRGGLDPDSGYGSIGVRVVVSPFFS